MCDTMTLQTKDIKKGSFYINRRNDKKLQVEDYFEGLILYHYVGSVTTRSMQERWFCKNMKTFKSVKEQCKNMNIQALLRNSAISAHKFGLISKQERDAAIDSLYPKKRIRKTPFISR
jgi:hypothetical protein